MKNEKPNKARRIESLIYCYKTEPKKDWTITQRRAGSTIWGQIKALREYALAFDADSIPDRDLEHTERAFIEFYHSLRDYKAGSAQIQALLNA